jgi:AcrR family transcriptional regulator
MTGGRRRSGGLAGTPRGELARIREGRESQDEEARRRIMTAMLEACGEGGYRNVSVQDVIDRCGGNRVQFYRHFASKEDCFAAAFEDEIELVDAEVRAAAAGRPGWRSGLRAGLAALADYVERRPLLARGLAIEVHVAGGRALATRAEAYERATGAIDMGRLENESEISPPPAAAEFLLGAIEATITRALVREEPQEFAAAIPELIQMIVSAYLGEAAAEDEAAAPAV